MPDESWDSRGCGAESSRNLRTFVQQRMPHHIRHYIFLHSGYIYSTGPTSQDAKPRVWPWVYNIKGGENPGLNPGFSVLRCGLCTVSYFFVAHTIKFFLELIIKNIALVTEYLSCAWRQGVFKNCPEAMSSDIWKDMLYSDLIYIRFSICFELSYFKHVNKQNHILFFLFRIFTTMSKILNLQNANAPKRWMQKNYGRVVFFRNPTPASKPPQSLCAVQIYVQIWNSYYILRSC
jgi:hypothetical protein